MNRQAERRQWVSNLGWAIAGAILSGPAASRGPIKTAPVWNKAALPDADERVHLLNRCTFGITPESLAEVESMGYEAWVDWQLEPELIDDSETEAVVDELYPLINADLDTMSDAYAENQFVGVSQIIGATLYRMVYSRRQLFERIVEFWNDHFNVYLFDGPVRILKLWEDREVMRKHALGRFGDLLLADARSPAMLYYLDNFSNTVEGPNENYARELLELHTLGVDGGYTETDVLEAARCFTGWSFDTSTEDAFAFISGRHDYEEKVVLGVTYPAGQGIEDGEQLLAYLAASETTARFVCRKMCVRFVSDNPPESLVDQLVQTWLDTDGDLRQIFRALFLSDEFKNSQGQKFKRPLNLMVSMLRASQAWVLTSLTGVQLNRHALITYLNRLGQNLFTWTTPDGFPDTQSAWDGSAALVSRWNMAFELAEAAMSKYARINPFDLAGEANTPGELADRLISQLLYRELSASDRKRVVDLIGEGKPENARLPTSIIIDKTREATAFLLASPWFQTY